MMARDMETQTGIAMEVSEMVKAMKTMLEKSMVVVYARQELVSAPAER